MDGMKPGSQSATRTQETAAVDEPALMAAIAQCRMDAFEAFYRLYHPRLSRFIGGVLRNAGAVEEVLDDTMMVVWRRAGDFQPGSRVSSWVFAIAYRQALRSLPRRPDAVEYHEQVEVEGGSNPEVQQQQGQLRSGLDHALLRLSPEQRAALELTYYWGHSCAEVAEILQCPVDTVKTRMFYGRRRLREMLGPEWKEAI
jgi:RNA polymerase sigma-70 factor (ECF subfamily)